MHATLVAALLLSVAAYIHTRSADPAMRPENVVVDTIWRGLSFAALIAWGALVVKLFVFHHWSEGLAALLGSFALNWYFDHRGPKPTWPGLSMLFGVVGLGLAGYVLIYE